MWEVEGAAHKIFSEILPYHKMETVLLSDSLDQILSEDIFSHYPIPAFPTSIKDGFSMRSCDKKVNRNIRDVVGAGDKVSIEELKEQTKVTQSVLEVKDAFDIILSKIVCISEQDIIPLNGALNRIVVNDIIAKKPIQSTNNSVAINSLIIKMMDKITEKHLSILPLFGYYMVKVFKRPQISVIFVGTNVKSLYDNLETGEFFDTNRILIVNKLKKFGYQSFDGGIANSPDSSKHNLIIALTTHGVIIASGGVSKKDNRFLKHVLIEDFGAAVHVECVNLNLKQERKNVIFATLIFKGKHKYVFGLPGKPDHASISMLLFVIPAIRHMERNSHYEFPEIKIKTDANYKIWGYPEDYVDIIDKEFYYSKNCKNLKAKCLIIPGTYSNYYSGLLIES